MLIVILLSVISIVVCRFILRLRQVYLPAHFAETFGTGLSPSLLAGNMGAPLGIGVEDDDDSGDEEDEEVIVISDRPLDTSVEML